MFGSLKAGNNPQSNSDAKHAVCDVERRPMMLTVINIDKVTHEAIIKYSVIKIAANTGGKESESNVNQSLPGPAEEENRKNRYQRNARNYCEPANMPGE